MTLESKNVLIGDRWCEIRNFQYESGSLMGYRFNLQDPYILTTFKSIEDFERDGSLSRNYQRYLERANSNGGGLNYNDWLDGGQPVE